jgi:hypothetical protein
VDSQICAQRLVPTLRTRTLRLLLGCLFSVAALASWPTEGDAVMQCSNVMGQSDNQWGPERNDRTYPYPWWTQDQPGDAEDRINAIPRCRFMTRGTRDQNNGSAVNDSVNMNDYASIGDAENANPDSSSYTGLRKNVLGNVSWPLKDSYGSIITYMVRPWADAAHTRLANYWYFEDLDASGVRQPYDTTQGMTNPNGLTRNPDGRLYALPAMEMQGRGCMKDDALESKHAIIGFKAAYRGTSYGKKVAIRAFIERRALPDGGGQIANDPFHEYADGETHDVDLSQTGCAGSSLATKATLTIAAADYNGSYIGSSTDRVLNSKDYDYDAYEAIHEKWMPVMAQTTSVAMGGIFRAVVKVGDRFRAVDCFGYTDPNVSSTSSDPTVVTYPSTTSSQSWLQWYHGQVITANGTSTRIYGYLPVNRPGGVRTVPCP